MMKLLAVCGLFALTKAQDDAGTAGCPCLAEPPVSGFVIEAGQTGEGLLRARPDGENVIPYPLSYGTLCGTHDVATQPYCADATGVALVDDPATNATDEAAPSWCGSSWCWVDPADCDTGSDPSSYFHVDGQNATLHYSYTTCASENTFTDSELDAQACNEEHSQVVAEHCSGGIQADARCPCVNWADDLDSRAQFENADGTYLVVPLGDNATTTDVDEGTDYLYVLGYGSGACAAHDATHAPYCADANGAPLADAPSWCQASWCWVDPTNCQLAADDGTPIPAVASSYFHRDGQPASRYYSYETCQHDNTFSDTELDPQACNDEHSTVVADHCLVVAPQEALTTCPCITMPDPHPFAIADSDPPMVNVSIGGTPVPYPAGYGIGSCAPHDQVLGPTCANADGSVKDDAPSWCSSNWCFVDPNACTGLAADSTEPVASTYFHRDNEDPVFFYSYGTCSHENTFTDSADDDQACNADHSSVADWCTPPENSVVAQLTLDIDMPADAAALSTFKASFQADIAATLDGVDADSVIITGVAAGSVVVDFYIAPAADGTALVAADAVTSALAAGVQVAGATLTSDSVTTAPAVTAPAADETTTTEETTTEETTTEETTTEETTTTTPPPPATPAPATSGVASATLAAATLAAAFAIVQ